MLIISELPEIGHAVNSTLQLEVSPFQQLGIGPRVWAFTDDHTAGIFVQQGLQ